MAEQESKTSLGTIKQVTKKNALKQKTNPLTYKEMIRSALLDLKEAKGTQRDAILNYICTNYHITNNAIASRRLNLALTAGVSDGTFKKSKGTNNKPDKYFSGDAKGLKTHTVTTKLPKTVLCVKTKTAQATKSKPQPNKRRIRSKQGERAYRKVPLVKTKVALKRKTPKQRNIPQQERHSESNVHVEQTSADIDEKLEHPITDTSIIPETTAGLRDNDERLKNIRFVKQDPINIKLSGDILTEHMYVSSLTATPDGKLLVVAVNQDCTIVKLFDREGQFLCEHVVSAGPHKITMANDDEALLLLWAENIIIIYDITSDWMKIKGTLKTDVLYNAKFIAAFQDKLILSCWDYPDSVKMIDRTGKLLWTSSIFDMASPPFIGVSGIVVFFEENKPKVVVTVADVPALGQGLVKLDAETGEVIKVNRSEGIHSLGMDVDIERGILYIVSNAGDYRVWGSTLDLGYRRELLATKTGISVGLCFNHANQQLLVASKDIIDRFQVDIQRRLHLMSLFNHFSDKLVSCQPRVIVTPSFVLQSYQGLIV